MTHPFRSTSISTKTLQKLASELKLPGTVTKTQQGYFLDQPNDNHFLGHNNADAEWNLHFLKEQQEAEYYRKLGEEVYGIYDGIGGYFDPDPEHTSMMDHWNEYTEWTDWWLSKGTGKNRENCSCLLED